MPVVDRRELCRAQSRGDDDRALWAQAAHLFTPLQGGDGLSADGLRAGLRIEEARRLIETGAGAIEDIGFHVGYEDSAFFRRLFKREVGLTPAAYRRKFVQALAAE